MNTRDTHRDRVRFRMRLGIAIIFEWLHFRASRPIRGARTQIDNLIIVQSTLQMHILLQMQYNVQQSTDMRQHFGTTKSLNVFFIADVCLSLLVNNSAKRLMGDL